MIFHYDMKTLTKNNFTMIDKQQKKKVYQEQLVNKQLQYFDQPISRELKTTRE